MLLLERWKTQGIDIKNIWCDDAGENKSLEKELIKRKINVNFEFTGAGTPQHNGEVERSFATLMGRVRAMLTYAGMAEGDKLRGKLWAECASTATHLDNIIVSKTSEKCSYERFHGKKSKMVQHLRAFGEIGIVLKQKGKSMKGKLNDRGKPYIFVGYSDQHSGDVYRMYNPSTGKVSNTRDVRFLNMTYGAYKRKKKSAGEFLVDVETPEIKKEKDTGRYDILKEETDSDEETSEKSNDSDSDEEKEPEPEKTEMTGMRTRSRGAIAEKIKINKEDARVRNAVKKLSVNWHPNTFDDVVEIALVGGTDDDYENPMSFDDAWNHPDEFERIKWREAIRKEIRDMIKRGVWRNVKKNSIPENRRLIGNKWVFKKKRNGVYRARLVCLGYTQIAGLDHQDNFSPVVNETTFRIVLVLMLLNGWHSEIVDIETAFLYGDLDEEIYMTIPEGIENVTGERPRDDEALILVHAMYGLVQAARQFFKKLRNTLEEDMGFKKCLADECLLARTNNLGTVLICLYIDDTLVMGDKKAIDEFKKEITRYFNTKEEGAFEEYVGCKVLYGDNELFLHQSDLIRKIEKNFGDDLKSGRNYTTPGTPGQGVVRPKEGEKLIDKDQQTKYRSGVGMLLFLVKYSRPDIANAVRELSKVNDGANEAHVKEMMRLIKFVLDTRKRCLKYKLDGTEKEKTKWSLKAFCDSDFAGDKNTRLSVTGYGIYLHGCLVSWKSRAMKTHALSSTEAEYIAMSEVVCEILFVRQILEFFGKKVDYPIVVNCDNVGAIFLAHNAKTSNRTKHIDIKTHFIREYVEKGVVKIVFVGSEDNDADIWTKNVTEKLYLKHSTKFMGEIGNVEGLK